MAAAATELWKSDGTEAGTVRVKDIRAGANGSAPSSLTNAAGTLYFAAYNETFGNEVWTSDGTDAGTMLVEDITGNANSADPAEITSVGDRLFLTASNDVFGRELWSGTLGSLQGDFDHNGLLQLADVDALVAEIAAANHSLAYDLNNDALVDRQDLSVWLQLAGAANSPTGNPYSLGDANLDGVVDAQDFIVWNLHKFSHTPAWSKGDFNADGTVDGQDFIIWNTHKFSSSGVVWPLGTHDPTVRKSVVRSSTLRHVEAIFAELEEHRVRS